MCVSFPPSLEDIQEKRNRKDRIIIMITQGSGWENIIFKLAQD